jgi:hypothetical protein
LSLIGLLALFMYLRLTAALETQQQEQRRLLQAERDRLEVEVARDGFLWHQVYEMGAPQGKVTKGKAVRRTGTTVTLNSGVMVTMADIVADNGIIHVIDAVLLPPSIADAAGHAGLSSLLEAATAMGHDMAIWSVSRCWRTKPHMKPKWRRKSWPDTNVNGWRGSSHRWPIPIRKSPGWD